MPYDIYGNYLRPGYCEVHPDVRGEYPCDECLAESIARNRTIEPEPDYYNQEPYYECDICHCAEAVTDYGGFAICSVECMHEVDMPLGLA